MTEIILVPGSFLAAASWDATADALRAGGVSARAVELTGLGPRSAEQARLEDHVTDVAEAVDAARGDVLVVAHSYAGVPAALAVQRMPPASRARARIVFLGATLPQAGKSVFDTYRPGAAKYLRGLVASHDGRTIPVLTPQQLDGWGEHGLVGPTLERFRACTNPHPVQTYEDPADPQFDWAFANPPTYINLTRDTLTVPREAIAHMTLMDYPDGHWPMITSPDTLGATLLALTDLVARSDADAAGCPQT